MIRLASCRSSLSQPWTALPRRRDTQLSLLSLTRDFQAATGGGLVIPSAAFVDLKRLESRAFLEEKRIRLRPIEEETIASTDSLLMEYDEDTREIESLSGRNTFCNPH